MPKKTSYPQSLYSYRSKLPIYSLAFSTKKDNTLRMAIGSLNRNPKPEQSPMNYVEVIELNEDGSKLKRTTKFEQKIPPSKILFFPDHSSANPDLLITSSDTLKIWEILETGEVEIRSSLWNTQQTEYSAPLTSFDWSPKRLEIICTCSIDTTCSIWDITKGAIINQLIAHDKEVFDINFSNDPHVFSTVGADGSLRQFDTRDLSKSDILFEGMEPLMRLSQNKINDYQIAFISIDQNYITILDKRKPFVAAHKLYYHEGNGANGIQFSPDNSNLIASVGSDGNALLWDTSEMLPEIKSPIKEYPGNSENEGSMENIVWSPHETNWIACCKNKEVYALKVDPKKGA